MVWNMSEVCVYRHFSGEEAQNKTQNVCSLNLKGCFDSGAVQRSVCLYHIKRETLHIHRPERASDSCVFHLWETEWKMAMSVCVEAFVLAGSFSLWFNINTIKAHPQQCVNRLCGSIHYSCSGPFEPVLRKHAALVRLNPHWPSPDGGHEWD